mmetsp:Transcript_9872/g.18960  ORF Transcript_9872/g.18960 Transcript_9872/m.18960 type:complete len:412 (-) Transcript_9872:570-1805(-)|eukprot:CAMPEP_0170191970 /NCGR_PEP_ID=MMETSP0040_2-20121228/53016_1 /TAXON_ID=641309 /ORGANISM="Lotharella oceanica, Strain CCMP622" /LENGTH=411 /DNA_ID=CAMNT_0010440205 /DNA_START=656 /DNA_END=1891 /DNA_ORIENTATION=-
MSFWNEDDDEDHHDDVHDEDHESDHHDHDHESLARHAGVDFLWSSDVRVAFCVIAAVVVVPLSIITLVKALKGRASTKRAAKAFRNETALISCISILGLIPLILNAATPMSVCGLVSKAVFPYYAVSKVSLYRLLLSKAQVFDVMRESPWLTYVGKIATYLAIPVLAMFLISDLVLFDAMVSTVDGQDICIASHEEEEGVDHDHSSGDHFGLTAGIITASDLVINSLCVYILVHAAVFGNVRSVKPLAYLSAFGGLVSMISTAGITISLAIANIEVEYIFLRLSCDYFLLDWLIGFLAVMTTFNPRIMCPKVFSRFKSTSRRHTKQGKSSTKSNEVAMVRNNSVSMAMSSTVPMRNAPTPVRQSSASLRLPTPLGKAAGQHNNSSFGSSAATNATFQKISNDNGQEQAIVD